MNFLTFHFRELRDNWDSSGLGWEVRRTAGAFAALVIVGFLICRLWPDLEAKAVDYIFDVFAASDIYAEDGSLSAAALFASNFQACVLSVLCGVVPFLQYPALILGLNAMVLGVLASYYITCGRSIVLYLAALLPHGIFELPALALGVGCGLFLCAQISRRILGRKAAAPFFSCLIRIAQTIVLLVIPLLALAAVAETYLTPWVITLFS